ncbi:MAG: hypothetical protein C0421_12880 [Hyphomonas sp.]|uniref:esterase-like activity of phytase family protein n=1 Tax=Hyphomonas sp. TaxID=87 RepID=UPI0025C145C8|nr:esterase-like activity of phytase family protein [Hyphomonas sp.]MBA4339726.1 hypothetical protein [Hyphomonas sp.]
MNRSLSLISAVWILALSGCAAPGEAAEPAAASPAAEETAPALWSFAASEDAIRPESCEEGGTPMRGLLPLQLSIEALNAKQSEVLTARLPEGAALAGAWELTSTDPNFGGLSGIALEDETTLLAVTDAGGWVKFGLDGAAPAAATIGYMRGADGKFLTGKTENDAEGLSVRDGIAFVSFERDFRIEAFDIGTCGASAKAVEIAKLPATYEGRAIDPNEGPEALTLTPAGSLRFGFEGATGSLSPLGDVLWDGSAEWSGTETANPDGFALVAMDTVSLPGGEDREIYLYRAFDPLRGARSVLVWGPDEADQLTLSRPVMTDNFEGLAALVLETGELRLWIVSDNNFSKMQRTLIYAFDVPL